MCDARHRRSVDLDGSGGMLPQNFFFINLIELIQSNSLDPPPLGVRACIHRYISLVYITTSPLFAVPRRWSRRRVVRTAVLTAVLVYLLFTFLLVARRPAELQADTNWAPGMARHIPPSYSTGHDNRPRPTRANRMHALARDKVCFDTSGNLCYLTVSEGFL